MTLVYIALAISAATFLGGLIALRFKDKLHIILGFSAGAVIAVAFFDLLPEALELGSSFYDSSTITSIVALGFIAYLIFDRVIFIHAHTHEDEGASGDVGVQNSSKGFLGASSLSLHSFFDGVAIGVAFQASAVVGTIVAIAVLIHDFSDGVNTANMIMRGGGSTRDVLKWLCIDAAAPIVGIISTLFFTVPTNILAIILAVFCGFFLYIGATDLIPESHHAHPKFLTTAMTILGAGLLYVAIGFAHI